jgi:Methyltransferase domain
MSVRRVEARVRAAVPSPVRRLLHPLRVALDPASPRSTRRKRATIRRYAKRFRTPVLVETGTYRGTTVRAMRRHFARIYSIELDDDLYARARRRFAGDRHVEVLHGDSGDVLPSLVERLDEPCLFWLDGHYSDWETARGATDSPLRKELEAVLRRPEERDVVLVDDARLLTGEHGYPTLEEIRTLVARLRPDRVVEVRDDIVRIHRCT